MAGGIPSGSSAIPVLVAYPLAQNPAALAVAMASECSEPPLRQSREDRQVGRLPLQLPGQAVLSHNSELLTYPQSAPSCLDQVRWADVVSARKPDPWADCMGHDLAPPLGHPEPDGVCRASVGPVASVLGCMGAG